MARRDAIWAYVPQSNSGVIDALEQRVIGPAPEPSVVIFGSSRARDGIIPRQRELGLPEKSVLNLGLTAGTPFDALALYHRNRSKLAKARVMVLALEDWHFNARIGPNARERRFASLGERIGVFDVRNTLSLIVGWAWRTYDAREPAQQAVAALMGHRSREFPIADDGRIIWRSNEANAGPASSDATERADDFYHPFALSSGRMRQIRRFVSTAREDGARVMLLRVPWRDAYVDYVQQRYPSEFQATDDALRSVDADEAGLFSRASTLGIADTHFHDYGHMTPVGAERFTRSLALRMTQRFGSLGGSERQSTRQ